MTYSVNSGSKTNNKKFKNIVIWRTIKEFPNYMVSSTGEIYSKYLKRLLSKSISCKYYTVSLYINGKTKRKKVHILVAKTFIKNPENLSKVDHIDNNRLNNNIKNLRWITQSNNSLSYHRNFRKFIPILQYDLKGKFIKKWKSTTEIIQKNPKYVASTINNNIRGQTKTAYNFIWKHEYIKENKIIKLNNDEIFKNIGIFEENDLSNYEISKYGKVRNVTNNKLLSLKKNDGGYMTVGLTKKNGDKKRRPYYINRLVAHAFISRSKGLDFVVNHFDKNKTNNYYKNLEWTSQKNNVIHSIGKPIKMIDINTNKILIVFPYIKQAAIYLGLYGKSAAAKLSACCKGKQKTAYGFKWEYLKNNETIDGYKNNCDVYIYDLD